MVNKYRGEVKITLQGQELVLRPTLQALCSIEAELGKSIIILLSDFESKGLTLDEQVVIIQASVSCTYSRDELRSVLYEQGLLTTLPAVCQFLQYAIGL
jgi:hypothetical protein